MPGMVPLRKIHEVLDREVPVRMMDSVMITNVGGGGVHLGSRDMPSKMMTINQEAVESRMPGKRYPPRSLSDNDREMSAKKKTNDQEAGESRMLGRKGGKKRFLPVKDRHAKENSLK